MASISFDVRPNLKIKGVLQGEQKNSITNPSKTKPGHLTRMTKFGSTPVLPPPAGKPRKLHNCLPPEIPQITRSRPTSSNLKTKSISLVELTSSSKILTHKKLFSKEQGDNSKLNHVVVTEDRKRSISFIISREECEIARQVCKKFLLNAWRRRRDQVIALKSKTQQLENEVENHNIQIVVLRNLLTSENLRVAIAMSDSAHLKGQLGIELKNTELIKKEMDSLKAENFNLVKQKQNMASEIDSLRTKLLSEEVKCINYQEASDGMQRELTLTRQREKECLKKLEDTEYELKKKISSIEAMWVSITKLREDLTNARFENAKLREEIDIKESESNEQIVKIKEKSTDIILLQEKCKVHQDNAINLRKDFNIASKQIKEQAQTIDSLNEVVKQFEKERKELDQNLIKIRNKVIFQSIRMSASLLIPTPQHVM